MNERAASSQVSDPLTRALLPVLLHKLGNATQLLTGLNALLTLDGGEQLFALRARDLAQTSSTIEDLGWVLAVLGSASGSDVLLERREPRGLDILLPLVVDSARRQGHPIEPARVVLPLLAPDALDGWQLPWGIGSLLWAAAQDRGAPEPLPWKLGLFDDGDWFFQLCGEVRTRAAAETVLHAIPGAAVSVDGRTWTFCFPRGWFVRKPA